MKLLKFHITNFKSWKELSISYKEGLNIFIGKNNSGKSNIFRAIEFLFKAIMRGDGGGEKADHYMWHRKIIKDPIKVTARFKIEDSKVLQKLEEKNFKGDEINLEIKINSNSDGVVNNSININGFQGEKMAILNLLRDNLVFIKADRGINQKENLEMGVTSSSDGRKIKSYFHTLKNNINNKMYLEIQNELKKILPQVDLDFFIDEENRPDISVKDEYSAGDEFNSIISDCGSGLVDILVVITNLIANNHKLFLIEEPEIHLHPEGQRALFDFIKRKSKEKQIMIATHSSIFIDSTDPCCNLFLIKKDKESRLIEIKEDDIKQIRDELHIKPSDGLVYANTVLFVEGDCDEIFISNVIKNSNIGLGSKGLVIYPSGGCNEMIKFGNFCKKTSGIPLVAIGDSDFLEDSSQLVGNGFKREDIFILENGELEDNYPLNRIIEAINVISNNKIILKEAEMEDNLGIYDFIEKKCWEEAKIELTKKMLVQEVSKEMIFNEICEVQKEAIRRCGNYLGLKIEDK